MLHLPLPFLISRINQVACLKEDTTAFVYLNYKTERTYSSLEGSNFTV